MPYLVLLYFWLGGQEPTVRLHTLGFIQPTAGWRARLPGGSALNRVLAATEEVLRSDEADQRVACDITTNEGGMLRSVSLLAERPNSENSCETMEWIAIH